MVLCVNDGWNFKLPDAKWKWWLTENQFLIKFGAELYLERILVVTAECVYEKIYKSVLRVKSMRCLDKSCIDTIFFCRFSLFHHTLWLYLFQPLRSYPQIGSFSIWKPIEQTCSRWRKSCGRATETMQQDSTMTTILLLQWTRTRCVPGSSRYG